MLPWPSVDCTSYANKRDFDGLLRTIAKPFLWVRRLIGHEKGFSTWRQSARCLEGFDVATHTTRTRVMECQE